MARSVPPRRWAKAEEIGSVITFLPSSDASFMTGSVVPADGGTLSIKAAVTNFLTPPLDAPA